MSAGRLHPVQREMLRLEAAFDDEDHPAVAIDLAIAQLSGFDGDVKGELDPILTAETARAVVLARDHYGPKGNGSTPSDVAAIGFLQGVTFAAAVRNLKERES